MIPVGARLNDRKFVIEGRTRRNPGEAYTRDAVHRERYQQSVPVDRTVLVERVGHTKADVLALFQTYYWPRDGPIDTDCATDFAIDPNCNLSDRKGDFRATYGR